MIQGVGKGKETQLVTGVGVFSQQLVFAHRFSQELVFARRRGNRPLPSLSASDDFFLRGTRFSACLVGGHRLPHHTLGIN
jgi:hypothetical protein